MNNFLQRRSSDEVSEAGRRLDAALVKLGLAEKTAAAIRRCGRLLFCLDLTGSREASLRGARIATARMFDAIKTIGSVSVKLVYYRGTHECRAGSWHDDPGAVIPIWGPAGLGSRALHETLTKDLKSRGMLEDTLVVWTTEFGRTPFNENPKKAGREHHNRLFSSWLAGGGVKAGTTYGESDEYGIEVGKDMVHFHDFHATLLHLLGMDHKRLTYRYSGRDFRLTDVAGEVVKGILA